MTVFQRSFSVEGDLGSYEAVILFGSASTLSMVRPDVAVLLAPLVDLAEPEFFDVAHEGWRMRADQRIWAAIRIGAGIYQSWFWVVPGLGDELVAGVDFLQEHRFVFDYRRHQVRVGRNRFDLAPPPPRRR